MKLLNFTLSEDALAKISISVQRYRLTFLFCVAKIVDDVIDHFAAIVSGVDWETATKRVVWSHIKAPASITTVCVIVVY